MRVEAETMAVEQIAAIRGREWAAENGALIIDVREPHEWAMGTLPGAELIRLNDLPGRLSELDRDQAALIVCRTGNRSNAAAAFMARNGFGRVANLRGGLFALGLA
jgi:rhodanese-related sulfurtransferase